MADFSISHPKFPEGATVAAYPAANWPAQVISPSGAPLGSADDSAVVSAGVAALSGLTNGARYFAHALVGSEHRYVGFTAGADVADAAVDLVESGILADRPSSGQTGQLYFATDELGGTLYRYDGSAWVVVAPRGTQLLSLKKTTDEAISTTTTPSDVTGLNGTVTSRGRPWVVTFGYSLAAATISGVSPLFYLLEDVGDLGVFTSVGIVGAASVGNNGPVSPGERQYRPPAYDAGTVVRYKIQKALSAASGTATVYGTSSGTYPFRRQHLSVEEV